MRHFLEAERLKNLGHRPPSSNGEQDASLKMPPPNTTEAVTHHSTPAKKHGPGSDYFGDNYGLVVLSALSLSFDQLAEHFARTNKPILDVGASVSTLAIEGTFRDIPIYGTDLKLNDMRAGVLSGIERRVSKLKEAYLEANTFPVGFDCFPISETAWKERVAHGIKLVDSRMSQCTASEILLPNGTRADDRHFSITLSHHAVPKYSDMKTFFAKELPELLRVTNDRLYLFPLASFFSKDTVIHAPGSDGRKRLESIARDNGFSLEVQRSPTYEGDPKKEPGFNMVGIFVRHNNLR